MKMSIQFVLCCWTLLEMSELWMCDEREKKKEEEDKEGDEKKRELLPCWSFPPTKALPPSFSLRTSVSFQREFVPSNTI